MNSTLRAQGQTLNDTPSRWPVASWRRATWRQASSATSACASTEIDC